MALAMARKYKSKANIWLGLGAIATSSNLIDIFVFSQQPWKEEPELEELTKVALQKGKTLFTQTKK